jgi:hypothetical protein
MNASEKKAYLADYKRILLTSKQTRIFKEGGHKPFKWLINIDAQGVDSTWKAKLLAANGNRGISVLTYPQVNPLTNSSPYGIDADSKPLKLRLPFDLLEPKHFRVQVKKSTSKKPKKPEDEENKEEKERKQRELKLKQIRAMRTTLDFRGSDGDDSQCYLEFKHLDDKVLMLKNGNIAIGGSSYLPSDVEFVFGTPIGQAAIVLTDAQLITYLSEEFGGIPEP